MDLYEFCFARRTYLRRAPHVYRCLAGLGQENRLGVGEFLHAESAMLTPIAGIFHPAKGHIRISSPEGVDADHACVEMLSRELQGAVLVLREYPAAQTVAAVIRETHRVFIILCTDDRRDGSEDFIVKRRHTGFESDRTVAG